MKLNAPLILRADEVLDIIKEYCERITHQPVESVALEGSVCLVRFKPKMANVWHVKPEKFGQAMLHGELRFPLDYHCVARVASTNLDKIFELTNHISGAWYDNPGVECFIESRSTSVGDVIVMNDNKTLFLCLPMGWKEYHGVPQLFKTGLTLKEEEEDDSYNNT